MAFGAIELGVELSNANVKLTSGFASSSLYTRQFASLSSFVDIPKVNESQNVILIDLSIKKTIYPRVNRSSGIYI